MGSIAGIGGVFIRSAQPERLNRWYETTLGLDDTGSVVRAYGLQPGEVAPQNRNFILTFNVLDFDRVVGDLKNRGVDVEIYTGASNTGRCARLYDPDGNPVELWCDEAASRALSA
jgi:catechol-2,3-dioxygenase